MDVADSVNANAVWDPGIFSLGRGYRVGPSWIGTLGAW